jgi:hypothetical protein
MLKRCLITVFVVVAAINSLAAVSPHLDGEGGCSVNCCQSARGESPASVLESLCCKLVCNQPASVPGSSATNLTPADRQKTFFQAQSSLQPEAILYIRQVRFPSSPTQSIAGSSDRFLQSGSLRI